jgi:hypothetical protein
VYLSRAEGTNTIFAAVIADRSTSGIGLVTTVPFARGTVLKMCPRGGAADDAPILVQVRHYRQKGNKWLLGCQLAVAQLRASAGWDR